MKPLVLLRTLLLAVYLFVGMKSYANCNISSPAATNTNPFSGCSGIVTITAKITVNSNYNFSALGITQVILAAPAGELNWTGNNNVTFPANSELIIQAGSVGLTTGANGTPCNAIRTITFGAVTIASCNGNGSNYSFSQVNTNGGITGALGVTGGSNSPVCSAGTLLLSATPNGGISPYSYSWTGPGGFSSTSQNPTTTGLAGTYTVTVTDGGNNTAQNSVVVSNTGGTPNAPGAIGASRCGTGTVNLSASVGIGETVDWYDNPSGGSPLAGGAGTFNYTTPSIAASTTYYAEARNSSSGCVSSGRTAVIATVNPPVTPSVSISATASTICAGTQVNFTTSPNNGGTPTYQWKLNGGNVGGNSNSYSSNALVNGDVISCEMSSSDPCAVPSTATSNSITMTVNTSVTPGISISLNNLIACSSGLSFNSSITNGGGSPGYQWQINGSNVGGANAASFTPSTINDGDLVTCVLTSSAACPSPASVTSNTITASFAPPTTTWLGLTSNWSSLTNWSNGIPNNNKSAIIPSGTPNNPIISSGAEVYNLSIASGASILVSPPNQMDVYGDFTNNGTFNAGFGTVNFVGCASSNLLHNIGGSSTTTFFNLILDDDAGLSVDANAIVLNDLFLTNGTMTNNGVSFIMRSTSTNTARLRPIGAGATFSGNMTIERFAPGPKTGWALLGSPAAGTTLNSWQDDFATSGFPGSTGFANGFRSVYTYNETVPGAYDATGSYVPATNTTNPTPIGRGFWVFLGTALVNTADITIDVTGQPQLGNFNFPLSYTNTGSPFGDGFNLIANPYPSAIDWDSPNWTKTNIENAVYTWQADNNQSAAYVNGVSINGGSRYLASSQGFFIQANGASPVLTIQENAKTAFNPVLIREVVPMNTLKLGLAGNDQKDETAVYLYEGATMSFDPSFDARKMVSPDASLPFIAVGEPGQMLAINAIPAHLGHYALPVSVMTPSAGTFTLNADGIDRFSKGTCIMLEDLVSGQMINLNATPSYSFESAGSQLAMSRFVLHITPAPAINLNKPQCNQVADGKISLSRTHSTPVKVWVNDEQNKNVKTILWDSENLQLDGLKAGLYQIEYQVGGVCAALTLEADLRNSKNNLSIVQNPTSGPSTSMNYEVKGAPEGSRFTWNFGDGTILDAGSTVSHNFNMAGNYQVTAEWKDDACETVLSVSSSIINAKNTRVVMRDARWYVVFNQNSEARYDIRILNAIGQQVGQQSFTGKTGQAELNLQDLKTGIYLIQISGKGITQTERINKF